MAMTRSRRVFLGFVLLSLALLPLLNGQERPAIPPPAGPASVSRNANLDKMTPLQRDLYISAQRGADWLRRANKPDGRFVYGFLPALRLPMEEDSYLHQVEAACVLGRSARFFHNEEADAIARQALLTLLLDTVVETDETQGGQIRHTIQANALVNRPAAAGLLVRAIHELPAPAKEGAAKDLLDQADQLCNFLKKHVQSDGSILLDDSSDARETSTVSGSVLLGIIRSQTLRPAPWKLEALRRARGFYEARWQQHKNYPMLADHSAAFAEAFALTKERAFAEHVFAMNDWLCSLQYQNLEARRIGWNGGFMPWVDGKPAATLAPDIRSAEAAQSLAEACRVARLAGDPNRHKHYKEALENCLRFLITMQYNEANTQHFVERFRPFLVGGFYASLRDGNLRLDFTTRSLNGLVGYLDYVAELP